RALSAPRLGRRGYGSRHVAEAPYTTARTQAGPTILGSPQPISVSPLIVSCSASSTGEHPLVGVSRHTCASLAIAGGANVKVLQALLGTRRQRSPRNGTGTWRIADALRTATGLRAVPSEADSL